MAIVKQFADFPFGMLGFVKAGQAGQAVVLLHGIPTSSFMWRNVVGLLAKTQTCYAVDMLGYGDSDKAQGQSLSIVAQADYLKAWADSQNLAALHLVGHDIGGG